MVSDAPIVIPLPLEQRVVEQLVYYCVHNRDVWARLAPHITAGMLPHRPAQLAFDAALALSKEIGGRGPGDWQAVVQGVRWRYDNDRDISFEDLLAVADLLDRAHQDPMPIDTLVALVVPLLQERKRHAALDKLITGVDTDKAAAELASIGSIGVVSHDLGIVDFARDLEQIASELAVRRLPTPVIPLTSALDGGLAEGNFGIVSAFPGGGKSMYLSNQAAVALVLGYNVLAVSGELTREHWLARVFAALSGVPEKLVRAGSPQTRAKVRTELAKLPKCGRFAVTRFEARVFTLADLRMQVERTEQELGAKIHVIVVDYPDLFSVHGEPSEYKAMGVVYHGLREIAVVDKRWIWGASQPKGAETEDGTIFAGGLADSQNKIRAVDLMASVNKRAGGKELLYHVGKNRLGEDQANVGPYAHGFALGRMSSASPLAAAFATGDVNTWPAEFAHEAFMMELGA